MEPQDGAPRTRKEKREAFIQKIRDLKRKEAKNNGRNLKKFVGVSWNCDTLENPEQKKQTTKYLAHHGIKIALLQETKEWDYVEKNIGEYLYVSTKSQIGRGGAKIGGVGAFIHHTIKVDGIQQHHQNLLQVQTRLAGQKVTFCPGYAPQERAVDSGYFWKTFKTSFKEINRERRVIYGMDVNGRLGKDDLQDFTEIGPNLLVDKTTNNANKILKIIEGEHYRFENTFFKPKTKTGVVHTYQCGQNKTQIDYIIQKGCQSQAKGWTFKNCHPEPRYHMHKTTRTHLPLKFILQKNVPHGTTEVKDKKPQIDCKRLTEDTHNHKKIHKPETDHIVKLMYDLQFGDGTQEEIRDTRERVRQVLRDKEERDTRVRQTNECDLSWEDKKFKRDLNFEAYTTAIKEQMDMATEKTWPEIAKQAAEITATYYEKERKKTVSWHGVPIQEDTAKILDEKKQVEDLLVWTIQFCPRHIDVFEKIQEMKEEIKRLGDLYEESAHKDEQQYYEERAAELDKGPASERDAKAWKLVQTILKRLKGGKQKKSYIQNNAGKKCWTPPEKAAAFGEFLKDNFTEDQQDEDTDDWWDQQQETPEDQLPEELPTETLINQDLRKKLEAGIQKDGIKRAILRAKKGRSHGPDDAVVEIFQSDVDYWADRLGETFQNPPRMVTLSDGRVAYIFKNKGKQYLRTFYRPISVLNAAYKIWASAQTELANEVVNQTMSPSQGGFRPEHAVPDNLSWNSHVIYRAQEEKLSQAYMDMSKAFDKAKRRLIWKKLLKIGCAKSWVSDLRLGHLEATLCPSFEGAVGDKVKVTRGVYQGSPLSPVLFILFSQEFNEEFVKKCRANNIEPIKISMTPRFPNGTKPWEVITEDEQEWWERFPTGEIHFTAYADDTNLPKKNFAQMKLAITLFEQTCVEFGMAINRDKTEVQTREELTEAERKDFNENFLGAKVGEERIAKNVRLLGAYSNIDGFTAPAMQFRLNFAKKAWKLLRKPFFMAKRIKLHTRCIVFNAIISSSLFFGMESIPLTPADIKIMQAFQSRCLREIYDPDLKHIAKHMRGEVNEDGSEIEPPKNPEIQAACQIPSARTRHKWQVLNFTRRWVNKTNLTTIINKYMIEGEEDPPKKGIKRQAPTRHLNLTQLYGELQQRYAQYRAIIVEEDEAVKEAYKSPLYDFDHYTDTEDYKTQKRQELKEELERLAQIRIQKIRGAGFCRVAKIATFDAEEEQEYFERFPWTLQEIIDTQTLDEDAIWDLEETQWKGLARLIQNCYIEDKAFEENPPVECTACGRSFNGQLGLSTHLTRQDVATRKRELAHGAHFESCLDEVTKDIDVVCGPLEEADQMAYDAGLGGDDHYVGKCPWNIGKCTYPDGSSRRAWLCTCCRRLVKRANEIGGDPQGALPRQNRLAIQYQANVHLQNKTLLNYANQVPVSHMDRVQIRNLKCENPRKPALCKFPDKTLLWCVWCCKKAQFTPPQNLINEQRKRDAKERRRQAAAQQQQQQQNNGQGPV
jgi:hypothetical protein